MRSAGTWPGRVRSRALADRDAEFAGAQCGADALIRLPAGQPRHRRPEHGISIDPVLGTLLEPVPDLRPVPVNGNNEPIRTPRRLPPTIGPLGTEHSR